MSIYTKVVLYKLKSDRIKAEITLEIIVKITQNCIFKTF